MRAANWIQETTSSIAGTNGNGAVTMTQITGEPRFSHAFGTTRTQVRYVIEKASTKEKETGIGFVASNILTRTRPQVTWNGTTFDDSTPTPLQFGSTPTSGDVTVMMSPVAESQAPNVPGMQAVLAADQDWRDFPITNNIVWNNNGGFTDPVTANREYYAYYRLDRSGLLTGIQMEVKTAASGNCKWALYSVGHDGLPSAKIVDFTTLSTASTGIKTDTATGSWSPSGPVWLSPGWYAIGHIYNASPSLLGFGSNVALLVGATPVGRSNGYGWGMSISVAGSYAAGLPATPNVSSGVVLGAHTALSIPWFGLRVVA